jgi:integrase/recombinase XerD
MTWAEAIAAYLTRMRPLRAVRTLAQWAVELENLSAFAISLGLTRLIEFTEDHCEAYARHLRQRPARNWREPARLNERTVVHHLHYIRLFFRWAQKIGHIFIDPCANLVLKEPPKRLQHILTEAEVERILAVPDRSQVLGLRDAALLETLYGTGVRLSECAGLDLVDLDLRRQALRIRNGKGSKDRYQPLGNHLMSVLAAYLESSRPKLQGKSSALFLALQGNRLSRDQIGKLVAALASTAGLKATPHAFRHAFATHLMQGGADLLLVQALLGHANIVSTQCYTHLFPVELRKEHRQTHPRANRKRVRRTIPVTWSTLAEYQQHLKTLQQSQSTLSIRDHWLHEFQRFCQEQDIEQLNQITPAHVNDFHQMLLWCPSLKGNLLSPNTVSQALTTVRAFLRWGTQQGFISQNPAQKLVLSKLPRTRWRLLSCEEIESLLVAPCLDTPKGLRDRAILELLYSTNLGVNQLEQLNLEHVLLEHSQIRSGQVETLSQRLVEHLQAYLTDGRPELKPQRDQPALFLGTYGTRLCSASMLQCLHRYAQAAGLSGDIQPRVLRQAYIQHNRAAVDKLSLSNSSLIRPS